MKKDTLQRETNLGLNSHQIAEKYNISVKTVHDLGKEFNINLLIDYNNRLTPKQEEFLFGKILGDGYIRKPIKNHNSNIEIAHGKKQKDYVWYCYEYIKEWCNNPPKDTIQKRDPKIYKTDTLEKTIFITKCHPEFSRLRRYFYEFDRKVINNDILSNLTPLSLAIWYQDDGSIEIDHRVNKVTGIRLHTLQFPLEVNQKLCKWFLDKYGLFVNVNKTQKGKDGKQLYNLRISKRSFLKFVELVQPYIHNSMKYKIELKE